MLLAHAALLHASGGQTSTTAGSTSSFSTVEVTIPSVIGIDIETDVAINLAAYIAAAPATTGACPANVFPPPAGCAGAALYSVNSSTTTVGVPSAPAANTGNVWVAVFSNRAVGTLTLSAEVDAAWNPASGPGFATTALRLSQSGANNTPGAGFASPTNLTNAPVSIGAGTLPATFNWTRIDQFIDLAVPNASSVTFATGTYDADVIFTIAK